MHFEELLMKRELSAMQTDDSEKKRQAAIEFLKYAEEKFKAEKKEKGGVMSMFREKKSAIKESISSMVKKVTGDETQTQENHESSPKINTTHHHAHLVRGDSQVIEGPHTVRRASKKLQALPAGLHSASKKHIGHSKEDQGTFFIKKRHRERRLSVNFIDDLTSTESKVNFFRREIFDKKFRNLSHRVKKMLKSHYDELIVKRSKYREKVQKKADLGKNIRKGKAKVKGFGPWDLLWEYKYEEIKKQSPYNEFPSYKIRQVMVKGGDDLRQEIIAMQLIKKLQAIFKKEGASLVLRTYEIVVINASAGIIGRILFDRRICTGFYLDRWIKKKVSRINII